MVTRTVQVGHVSDLATEREIHEFFSFSGEIEHIEIRNDSRPKIAFVTFKDPQALEIALLLSGATIVDQIVSITPAENYVRQFVVQGESITDDNMRGGDASPHAENQTTSPSSGRVYVSKAQDVVSSMLAKGSALRQDAMNKARAFDEKHQLRANASARVNSFDKRVGLTQKFSVGISVVNEKVKSVDQRLQVSDKTMAALMAAERKLNNTGTAVKSSRYVTAGTSWLNGTFGKVAKAGQVAGTKTRAKWSMALSNLTAKDPPIAA
ncbi:binding partner of ACD11 1 [Daucus carota subsp. sativus]|uniref:RRM domain-containing protein n=1 Tax=Daucus carota subsp. sativus TaxID=79200 RepID=A0A162A1J9_DAUCS|nr:PREDICTED: binding partner of ACD11 1-like [Daucus carota subsp. sativus]